MAIVAKDLKAKARAMRRLATDTEKALWYVLRRDQLGGWRFRRQHPIPPYIVDFACIEARLVIEADGGQHATSKGDSKRDEYLRARGWRVLRFWNNEILGNREGVIQVIVAELGPHPDPPPRRGGGSSQGAVPTGVNPTVAVAESKAHRSSEDI